MRLAYLIPAAVLAFALAAAPSQAGPLGNVVSSLTGGGGDSGGSDSGGSGGGSVDLDASDGSVGISGVATVSLGGGGGTGGTHVGATVLGGGGGSDLSVPVGDSGASVDLPGVGDLLGGGGNGGGLLGLQGLTGGSGAPGAPGAPGAAGSNLASLGGSGGAGGSGFTGNGLSSSRLQLLVSVLQNRAWMRFAQGNKVCLANFGVANASTYVRKSERAKLQQILGAFSGDIRTLQQMMRRCRNGQGRMIDISRVIGVDLRPDGQLVVFTI